MKQPNEMTYSSGVVCANNQSDEIPGEGGAGRGGDVLSEWK